MAPYKTPLFDVVSEVLVEAPEAQGPFLITAFPPLKVALKHAFLEPQKVLQQPVFAADVDCES